ncbi:MAG: protein phosphatase CheZ [Nitrospiria bacterium]
MDAQFKNPSALNSMNDPSSDSLYAALGKIAKDLNQVLIKQEIVESHIKTASEDLPLLSNQLLDVTRFTEEETHKILEHTERVLENHGLLASKLRETQREFKGTPRNETEIEIRLNEMAGLVEENNKALMNILTGLSFQDLAGQRMKRMDTVLQDLQARILKLVVTYGMKKREGDEQGLIKKDLLNGLESSTGIKLAQCEVNDILKEFGF